MTGYFIPKPEIPSTVGASLIISTTLLLAIMFYVDVKLNMISLLTSSLLVYYWIQVEISQIALDANRIMETASLSLAQMMCLLIVAVYVS